MIGLGKGVLDCRTAVCRLPQAAQRAIVRLNGEGTQQIRLTSPPIDDLIHSAYGVYDWGTLQCSAGTTLFDFSLWTDWLYLAVTLDPVGSV